MYAITETSFRAIREASDALPDETAVNEIPAHLMERRRAQQTRVQRDCALRLSDWTQMPDAPLTEQQRAEWATYRQALRDWPQQDGFPDTPMPTPPGLPDGAAGDGMEHR